MTPKDLINRVAELIRKAPAGGPFHDAVMSGITYGVGGATMTVTLNDATSTDERTCYLVTFTRIL